MKKESISIYTLLDEKFINKFNDNHLLFIKKYYYSQYIEYCINNNLKTLDESSFFQNMRRRNIKLVQLCCPYCGLINTIVIKGSIKEVNHFNYCPNCGKSTPSENAIFQLCRMLRIIEFHSAGLEKIKNNYKPDDVKLITYDVYQLELVEITSIFEVMIREYFNAFLFIKYFGVKSDYLSKIINKDIGSDFLNIDKANAHYKKALNINFRELITDSNWHDLIDMVNMRNTIIHNNGIIDLKFKNSKSYLRLKDKIKGNLLFLEPSDIFYYFRIVDNTIIALEDLFEKLYEEKQPQIIANYYFNINKIKCN